MKQIIHISESRRKKLTNDSRWDSDSRFKLFQIINHFLFTEDIKVAPNVQFKEMAARVNQSYRVDKFIPVAARVGRVISHENFLEPIRKCRWCDKPIWKEELCCSHFYVLEMMWNDFKVGDERFATKE